MVAAAAVLTRANQKDVELTRRRAVLDSGYSPSALLLFYVTAASKSLLVFLMLSLVQIGNSNCTCFLLLSDLHSYSYITLSFSSSQRIYNNSMQVLEYGSYLKCPFLFSYTDENTVSPSRCT